MARSTARKSRRTRRTGLGQRLRADLIAGLAIVLPAGLTVMLLTWVVRFVDAKVEPLIPVELPGEQLAGFGLVFFVAFTVGVGMLTRYMIGRRVLGVAEGVVHRLPVARRLYIAAKQIVATVIAKGGTSFRRTCLVEFPDRGIWTVAAVAAPMGGEVLARSGETDLVGLLVPTAPNPATGFLIFAPVRDVRMLDLSLEEAAKLVMSAGLVGPLGYAPEPPARR
jgi:uncharacterized membrane protein